MLKLEFYVPRVLEDKQDVKKVEKILEKAKNFFIINVKEFVIDKDVGKNLKSNILWGLPITNIIKNKANKKTSLSTACFFGNNKSIMFLYTSKSFDRK